MGQTVRMSFPLCPTLSRQEFPLGLAFLQLQPSNCGPALPNTGSQQNPISREGGSRLHLDMP